jgi:DNA-binding SARP family transcriptional activator/uncharacterized membrane protein YheB (UPF0754 family)
MTPPPDPSGPLTGAGSSSRSDGDWAWLRQQVEALSTQLKGLATSLSNQQSVFVDIAGARTAQLQAALADIESATGEIRGETQRLRQLEDAIAHHLHDLVLDVVQPELRSQLGKQLPELIAASLAPELRHALSDWLPQVVAETVTPDVRRLLSEWLPVMVADTVQPEVRQAISERLPDVTAAAAQPEVRRVLAEKLPHLVADTVQPELRRILSDRLPAVVAEAVTPEVRDAVIVNLPDLVSDLVRPELRAALDERLPGIVSGSVTPEVRRLLAEQLPQLVAETVQPELRQTLAERLPYLVAETVRPEVRETLNERLPGVVAQVVNPDVRRTLVERLPHLVAETVQPELRQVLSDRLPGIVAEVVSPSLGSLLIERMPLMLADTISPELSVTLAEVEGTAAELRQEAAKIRGLREVVAQRLPESVLAVVEPQLQEVLATRVPQLVSETIGPALRSAVADALESRLPEVVADSVRPELRDRLAQHLPDVVAQAITPELVRTITGRLPELVSDAITPDLSVSLAEVEGTAAEMRAETARLRSLREVIAERLPQAVMVAVERAVEEAFPGRLPDMLQAIVGPALAEALARPLPEALELALEPALQSALARLAPPLGESGAAASGEDIRQLRQDVIQALPRLVDEAVARPLSEFEASASQLRDEAERLAALRHQLVADTPPPPDEGDRGPTPVAAVEASAAMLRDEAERLGRLRQEVAAELPRLAGEAVAAPLAEFEASAAELRREAERLGRVRQEILDQLPDLIQRALADRLPSAPPAAPTGDELAAVVREAVAAALAEHATATAAPPAATAGPAAEAPTPPATEPQPPSPERSQWAPPERPPPPGERVPIPPPSPAEFTSDHPVLRLDPEEPDGGQGSSGPSATATVTEQPGPGEGTPPGPASGGEPGQASPMAGTVTTAAAAPANVGAPQGPAGAGGRLDVDPALAAALAPQRAPNGVRTPEPPVVEEDPSELMCALPGLVAGPTLARGVGEAAARARLRRRRRRRAGPPAAGLHRRDPFTGELTRRLEWFALSRRQEGASANGDGRPELGSVPIGERGHQEVTLSLIRSGGLCLVGSRAREAARAIVLTFLAENDPDAGRAIVVGDLLPAATTFPGLGRTRDVAAVLSGLQTEISRRQALLAEAGVEDVIAYSATGGDGSLPLILVAASEMTSLEADRLRSLLQEGAPTGIVGLVVDSSLDAVLTLQLQGPPRVAAQSDGGEGEDFTGTRIFTVEREPAAELLEVLASARSDVEGEATSQPEEPFTVVPATSSAISVKILGGYRIDALQKEIRSGLRAKAKELLAFYLLHPEGTTLEEATEALWPETDARRGSEWFWTALGNLRSRLRSATETRDLKVIERDGDRYRIEPVFDVDLWRFQDALARAEASSGDPGWVDALQTAANLYSGELLAGFDWPWAEVPREDLRGRAVDVLVSMAATRLVGGDVRGALDALERAVEVDPLAEQLYRRIMRLHAKLSRPDQADATFRTLQARLGEIALEPTPESEKLYGELCGTR